MVVDKTGTVRNAEGYEGNLEEGLARYEAEFGCQPVGTADSPREIDKNDIPRVPDFAIWIKEARRKAEGSSTGCRVGGAGCGGILGTTDSPREIEAEPGFENGGEGAGQDEVAAMGLTVEGDRAKNQNEIVEVHWAIEEGAEETYGQADDGVRDPRRTEVSLFV